MAQISKKESNMWFVVKAFAILSVITAHMPFGQDFFTSEIVRNSLGQIGVGIFFIAAGYFYSRKPNDSAEFWKKKAKTVILPWFFYSTVVYIISAFILSGNAEKTVLGFIKNFLGIGTVYWYMTVMLFMLFIFTYIKKDVLLYACMAISIVSVALSAMGVIYNVWLLNNNFQFNQYFNVLNWVGFFALGVLLRKKNLIEKLINVKVAIISFIGFALAIGLVIVRNTTVSSYVDSTSLFVELFGFVFLLNASSWLSNSKLLVDIGKKSFFIYLMHVQVAGALNTRLPYNLPFFILRPIIVLALCYIVAVVFKFVLEKLKLSKFNFVFGLDR